MDIFQRRVNPHANFHGRHTEYPYYTPEVCTCAPAPVGGPAVTVFLCTNAVCDQLALACGGYCGECFGLVMANAGYVAVAGRFLQVSEINRARSAEWHGEGEQWSLADWSNAMQGEAGECGNVIKKIRRLDTGTNARQSEQGRDALVAKAKEEIADVYLYLDLLLEQLDPDANMYDVIAEKFNKTSKEHGFGHRLETRVTKVRKRGR